MTSSASRGPTRSSYLQSQLSQDLTSLAVGASVWSLLLEPNGKVCALVRVSRPDEALVVVDTDAGHGPAVHARLDRFRIRVKAEIRALDWRGVAVRGAAADGLVSWWADPDAVDVLGDEPAVPGGLVVVDPDRLEAARVVAGWPAQGRELTEATIPGELGPLLALAVSFTKGCYPGQELVERMNSRGAQAPRLLRRLRVPEGAHDLTAGAAAVAGGREVGSVTSAAGPAGLALLGRAVEPGAGVVEVDGVAVDVLPLH